jgi:putative ABC transport system substrate-binding protein
MIILRAALAAALALGVVTTPFAAHAQQPAMPLIGYLSARSSEDTAHLLAAFRRGLSEGGFVEGKNLTIEYRWARGESDRLPALAAELARRPLAVLVSTGGEPAALAAKAATTTTPIVFAIGGDPVKAGLVASYNRPGGNATGIDILTNTLEAKRLGLLHELVPQAATIGFLLNPNSPAAKRQLRDVEEAARVLGLRIHVLRANSDREIDAAFQTVAQRRIVALAVAANTFFDTRREKLVALAARHAAPTIYHFREYAEAGGLMSYGIDLPAAYRQVGVYAGQILKGAKPADMPVMQPTKFELVINLKTATVLGLTIPQSLLVTADQVIQ